MSLKADYTRFRWAHYSNSKTSLQRLQAKFNFNVHAREQQNIVGVVPVNAVKGRAL